MNRDSLSSLVPWQGETVTVRPSTETTIAISEIEVSEGGKEREEGGRERKRERERERNVTSCVPSSSLQCVYTVSHSSLLYSVRLKE